MKKINGIPVFQALADGADGVSLISMVDKPAMDAGMSYFSKKDTDVKCFAKDEEQRIVTFPAIRCDYPIFRKHNGNKFYLIFNKEETKKFATNYIAKNQHFTSINHSNETIEGVELIESYFISEFLRPNIRQFSEVADGSWMVSFHITSDEVWEKIKNGEIGGGSIEVNMDITPMPDDNYEDDLLERLLELEKMINEKNKTKK